MAKIDTTVGKLVEMIKGRDLRLPAMQRRYVWPATRVRDLLDMPSMPSGKCTYSSNSSCQILP